MKRHIKWKLLILPTFVDIMETEVKIHVMEGHKYILNEVGVKKSYLVGSTFSNLVDGTAGLNFALHPNPRNIGQRCTFVNITILAT